MQKGTEIGQCSTELLLKWYWRGFFSKRGV